ncbi:amidohydrolase [Zhihengliuella halotolerans]|uniref:amidohydrolase n=1 Tax=Zhihengliuella halotolerans TaxID=370736 RepID=UPI000C800851|nr:amidohydrolase [Zhihengliuella halotolerans]
MSNGQPDLIVCAAAVRGPEENGAANALAVTGGLISAVGTRAAILPLAASDTRILELDGGTIVPGFVDAHTHPVLGLEIVRGVDLSGILTSAGLREALAAAAADLGADDWFLGWGLDPNAFEGSAITNSVLHEILGSDRPAFVTLFDAHSALASNETLRLAGVDAPRSFDDGSRIVDDGHGSPSGHLLEFSAIDVVRPVLPTRSVAERARQLHVLLNSMAAAGVTATHVMDFEGDDTAALLTAAEDLHDLAVDLRFSPWCTPASTDDDLERLAAAQGRGGRAWRIEGIKFFIDGTVEGGTAWLDTPDSRGENTASVWTDVDRYARCVAFFHERGIQTATHAIGERGIRFAAETLAALPSTGVQHRIEHIESVPDDVVRLIARHGIAASIQPTHCTHYTRADGSDDWSVRLGADRASRAWPTRDFRNAGAILALGSDWPIAPFEPLPIMADAQLRRPVDRADVDPVLPAQGLTALQALEGYTTHAHRAIGSDGGSLAAGAPADFVVLDCDPLASSAERLGSARVLLTARSGRITHQS